MTSATVKAIDPDTVMSFEINPGTILQFLETRPEKGPRLKCFEGSVTLVSSGRSHESAGSRLDLFILAVCYELRIKRQSLSSTTWTLPLGAGDTAYEADKAYYIQNHGSENQNQPPDLAIEIVVSHSERKALVAGALLKIPEIWVFDVTRHRLTFYHRVIRDKQKSTYQPQPRSRAFPELLSDEVLERLDDPETEDVAFLENCRAWAKRVLRPRRRNVNGGA
jgi:Uma2 family endonuclease